MTNFSPKKPFNIVTGLLLLFLSTFMVIGVGEILLGLLNIGNEIKINKNWFDENVTYNSWGHRDGYQHTLEKPKGKFRVLVLGDSMTVGHGIKNVENTYPKKLESYLNEKLQLPQFEVINTAGSGWNTDTELYDLFINGFKFRPDMVFLAYYHNDIPRPNFLSCDAGEVELVSGDGLLKNLLKQSRLYGVINLRINRLLEKMGNKPKFTDCINAAYSSIGWQMEKVYLDAINMACVILNVKLVIGIIPLMYQLDDEYPIHGVHSKLMGYCKERGIECIDFYEDGFKGLEEKRLIISENDRHLNTDGAEIVARVLHKKLQPLVRYKHLPFIHRAFTLQELLKEDETARKVDRSFDQIKEGTAFIFSDPLGLSNKTQSELKVWKESKNFYFLKTIFDVSGKKKAFTSRYVLDKTGEFINHTFSTFDPKIASVRTTDFLESKDNRFISTKKIYQSGVKNGEQKTIYKFNGIKQPEGGWSLRIEEGIHFHDPKTVVNLTLGNQSYSKSEKREILFYNVLISYYRYNWGYFADALIEEVVKRNPLPIYLSAIARLYRETKQFAKLDKLVRAHPQLN